MKLRNYFPSQFAFDFLELLHVLLSAQIKIGHATVWMRIRVCVPFISSSFLTSFRICTVVCAHPARDIHWIADAHGDGKRFVGRADEKLTAFLQLESATAAVERRLRSTPKESKKSLKETQKRKLDAAFHAAVE